ncbi:uncharacterized protein BP5553_05868 [Venustampulla echinocandica]|uniref:Uncharacterized protein n=1 Tax=Venustampulla echinocandica TaxID=2656787 RepID=A0A370TLW7_9HELO|nr:uncharacterized protein BP5553_05868 [Venustampulla echinocandica]RDL36516.1 hypothetical protein BP5553_05868 [Venustampulla echinocandica]
MDITVLFLEFLGLYGVWGSFKGMAYSIKLKVEFDMLNQLRDVLKPPQSGTAYNISHGGGQDVELNIVGDKRQGTGIFSAFSANDNRAADIPASNNGILKTTEIVMQTDQGDSKLEGPTVSSNKTKAYGNSYSPTSSKVEFAVEGV